jgi:hypothetical protein
MKSQFQAALKALHNQVQELKKQVHQATQREVAQTSQIATGVHAGDLKQHQQVATAPVSAGENKRKRQNSTGYVVALFRMTRIVSLTTTEILLLLFQSPRRVVLLQQRRGHKALRLEQKHQPQKLQPQQLQPQRVRHVGQASRHSRPRPLPSRWERPSTPRTRFRQSTLRRSSHYNSRQSASSSISRA